MKYWIDYFESAVWTIETCPFKAVLQLTMPTLANAVPNGDIIQRLNF